MTLLAPIARPARLETPADEVRQRFTSAVRSGRPAWLWPEIDRSDWRDALGVIAATLSARLTGAPPTRLGGDPAAFGLAAYTSGMGPLLGWWLEHGEAQAPAAIAGLMALHLDHGRRRAERFALAGGRVIGALARRGLSVAVLKGFHTAQVAFPEPGTRPAADIDLLVDRRDLAAAEATLGALGYVRASRGQFESGWRLAGEADGPRSLWLAHADDPLTIDLHHSLDVPVAAGLPPARLDRLRPLDRAAPSAVHPPALTLDPPLLLLHLAVHAGAALHNLTLLRQFELHQVARALGADDWAMLADLAEASGAAGYAFPALVMADRLAPGAIPAPLLDRLGASAPPAVHRRLASLTPATAQRVDRMSLAEHFMWSRGPADRLRQLARDLTVPSRIVRRRLWQAARGAIDW